MFIIILAAGLVFATGARMLLGIANNLGYLDEARLFCYSLAFLGGCLIGYASVLLLKG